MDLVLRQMFPLGRFHATPWKVFPFDDPHGEWPPSPWRLLRAIIARLFQWEREGGRVDTDARAALVSAFASSEFGWHLPPFGWRGPGLRQYHPAEFGWVPKSRTKRMAGRTVLIPGERRYSTTLVKDNFWVSENSRDHDLPTSAVWWVLSGREWPQPILALLDACLPRMTYFGRAESVTDIQRVDTLPNGIVPNCHLEALRKAHSVPVLAPVADVTIDQVQAASDDPEVAEATIPPGSRWMFAERPIRPAIQRPRPRRKAVKPVSLLQFAIGTRVSPPQHSVVVLTQRFRGRVVQSFLGCGWKDASREQREAAALLAGKNALGQPLEGHRHARLFIHFDRQTGKAARLLVWRPEPFDAAEQSAILRAAEQDLQLTFEKKGRPDPWTVRLVPLDSAVTPPPGFDSAKHERWRTATPYVPPRHVYDRRGLAKRGESVEEQVREELASHGFDTSNVGVSVASGQSIWTKVHLSYRERGRVTNAEKRGYHVELTFSSPVTGPIALGHSSHFGLGLFVPAK